MNDTMSKLLDAPLEESRVATRPGRGGMTLLYIPSHEIIRTANRIFGYGGWETEMPVPPTRCGNGYMCVMTVIVHLPHRTVKFSDAGYCDGEDDTAVKGAVSDALRRCLRHFGPQFGLDLYSEKPEEKAPLPKRADAPSPGNGKHTEDRAVQITEIIDTRGEYPYPYLIRFINEQDEEEELPCFLASVDTTLTNAVAKISVLTSAKGNKYIKKIERI